MIECISNPKPDPDFTDIGEDSLDMGGITSLMGNNFFTSKTKFISELKEDFTATNIHLPIRCQNDIAIEEGIKKTESRGFKNPFNKAGEEGKMEKITMDNACLATKITLNSKPSGFKDSKEIEGSCNIPSILNLRQKRGKKKKSKFFEKPENIGLDCCEFSSDSNIEVGSEIDTIFNFLKDFEEGRVSSILKMFEPASKNRDRGASRAGNNVVESLKNFERKED